MYEYNHKIGLIEIVEAYEHGCQNKYDAAGHLNVPVAYLEKTIDTYRGKNVVDMTPNKVISRFEHILKQANVPHFRFHDLRQYCASISHALGIPVYNTKFKKAPI